MFGFDSCLLRVLTSESSYEPSIPFVAPGYTERPTLGSCGEASAGAGSRYDRGGGYIQGCALSWRQPEGRHTASVATLAVQSVAVTVAVDPLGALFEGKPLAVVLVSCQQASSAGTFHALG